MPPRVALIVNPNASRVTPEVTAEVERELAAAGPVEAILTERPGHAVELVSEARGRYERLFVLAGDGGFNEAVNGIEDDVSVGFLRGGATNVLSRALGVPRDPVEAARSLAHSRHTRRISLGRVTYGPARPPTGPPNRVRRFTFAAGLGFDAEVVRAVEERGRRNGRRPGDLAFANSIVRALASRRGRLPAAMTLLGRSRVAFAVVVNGDPYTYAGPLPVRAAPEARFELGLDLVAPRELGVAGVLGVTAGIVRGGRHVRRADVVYVHDADELRIECDAPTPLQADGEDLGDVKDAHFECERGVLDVIVP